MSGVSWDAIRGTDRQMASALASRAGILWVDPPISPLTPAPRRFGRARNFRPVLSKLDDRVTRLTPVAFPGLTRPVVRLTTAALVRAQVRWALRRTGIRPFAVVASHIEDVLGGWGEGVVDVLYGTDDYVAGAALMGLSARRLPMLERRALARADVVVAVSPALAGRWTALGAAPLLIPNGCHPTYGRADTLSSAVRDLPAPVVGLVGQLSERIDADILEAIVDAGFSLLLVGPLDRRWEPKRFAALIARPRVHYAGPVPAQAVPSYLAAIDIGVTPYRDTPFNRASFPLKTLEYLGAGRPAVSADLPAARWLSEDLAGSDQAAAAEQILALAGGPAAFVAALRRIAGTPSKPAAAEHEPPAAGPAPVIADRCRAFAERHSWARRADAFAVAIGLPLAAGEHTAPFLAGTPHADPAPRPASETKLLSPSC
jgi:teichuronic acid biosynthesis glycosyltransferase TuaH